MIIRFTSGFFTLGSVKFKHLNKGDKVKISFFEYDGDEIVLIGIISKVRLITVETLWVNVLYYNQEINKFARNADYSISEDKTFYVPNRINWDMQKL
jgi:hypothetical protein